VISLSGGRARSSLYLLVLGIAVAMLAGFVVAYVDVGPLGLSRMLMTELGGAVVVLVLVATVAVLLAGRYLPFAIWSPIYGFIAVYLILGSAGYVYYRLGTYYLGGFYDIGVSETGLAEALAGFFAALASFLVGALGYLLSSRRFKRLRRSKARRQVQGGTGPAIRPQTHRFGVLAFAPLLVPFLLFVVGKGPGNLWWRDEYLEVEQYHFVYIMGGLLVLPVLLGIGYMLPAKKNLLWRIACVALFILYELLFLSSSSREFFIAPMFFIVGLGLGGVRRRTIVLLVVAWTLALPLLFNFPLELRGMSEQGLAPLLSNLKEIIAQYAGAEYFLAAETLVANITFGVPLAGYVKHAASIPTDYFLASLNPLPSFVPVPGLPLWYSFDDQLRVSPYMPFSALGELLNQGWLWLILYYGIVGVIAAWADIGTRAFEGQRGRWGFLFACGILNLFAITSTQYNLRSSTRFVYYAVLLVVAWRIFCRIRVVTRSRYTLRSRGNLYR